MLSVAVVYVGMSDARMRPRGDRFYRPPAAAPLSLKPDGHFQPPQWLKSVDTGGLWFVVDVYITYTAHSAVWVAQKALQPRESCRNLRV